jgi:hypothetical protein
MLQELRWLTEIYGINHYKKGEIMANVDFLPNVKTSTGFDALNTVSTYINHTARTVTTNGDTYNITVPAPNDILTGQFVLIFVPDSDSIVGMKISINNGVGIPIYVDENPADAGLLKSGIPIQLIVDMISNKAYANKTILESESCIVTVSTSDSQAVSGQTITLTNLTLSTTETYTLLTGETSHTFKVIPTQVYKISVNAKSGYITPLESAEFSAIAGNVRNVAIQYEKLFRYGFRRTKAESNPDTRIEYLFDAVGMTPAYMDFTSGNFNYGSWETFVNEVSRPVMLKTDGTVDYELSRNDMTKRADGVTASDVSNTSYNGNAMIEFRKFKWVRRYEDATYEYVIFSNAQYDVDYKAYAHTNALGNINDSFYWGAFKGSYLSSKMRSFANQTVGVSQTRNTEVTYATANGSGYYTIYKSGWDYIGDLLTLISKSDNSQAKFGSGRSKSTNTTAIATGTLKAQPYFKGYNDETSDVKVFGIEGFWGNVWEGMAGLILNSGIKTKMTPPYNFDGTGYTNTGVTPSGTSGGFVNTASVTDASGYVPKTASGSGTTYYCDGLWFNNSQVDYALVGGGWNNALLVGCRFVYLSSLPAATSANFGSRLSYNNPA